MIISFYDKDFKGLQNNASLVIEDKSYKLVKRGVDFDTLTCVSEAYTQNIQPVFLIVKNDVGNYKYGALAGIPERTKDNKTKINASDLKTMFNSELILEFGTYTTVNQVLEYIFAQWLLQVNQNSFTVELVIEDTVNLTDLIPPIERKKYNAWQVIRTYLRFYNLFMTSEIDLINQKVVFTVAKAMQNNLNVKLQDYGILNYGKWIASINEIQANVLCQGQCNLGTKWILTSNNQITTNTALRDIFPVKRKMLVEEVQTQPEVAGKLAELNKEALIELVGSMYNEDIEIPGLQADFKTKFSIFLERGAGLYKELPCGELHFDSQGLILVKIGYRFTGLEFIL